MLRVSSPVAHFSDGGGQGGGFGAILALVNFNHKGVAIFAHDGADGVHVWQEGAGFVGRGGEQHLQPGFAHELQGAAARSNDGLAAIRAPLRALASYHAYMHEMAKGYIKDPAQREEHLAIVWGWKEDAEGLGKLLKGA